MFLPDNNTKEPTIPELKFEDIIVQINKLDKSTSGVTKFQEVNVTFDKCDTSQKIISKSKKKFEEGLDKSFSELDISNHSKNIEKFYKIEKKHNDEVSSPKGAVLFTSIKSVYPNDNRAVEEDGLFA